MFLGNAISSKAKEIKKLFSSNDRDLLELGTDNLKTYNLFSSNVIEVVRR